MSKYTTGEMAKLCGVSVRAVQYYDTRGILIPSELSDGGRRLYSDEDLQKLRIICFLRELDLPINTIGELMREDDPSSVIELILNEQENTLRSELAERQQKLEKLEQLRRGIRSVEHFTIESIGDVANVMENRKKLRNIRITMAITAVIMAIIEYGSLIYWLVTGTWQPFAIGMVIVIAMSCWLSWYYFTNVHYICPKCHKVFKPRFKQALFANHTPTTRKLTCPACGHKGFCVETAAEVDA
ncbi:MAG: MerR family transcriptional regulator [Clostridia bacterium]|nr:MerR family transcriptional regulator [Clostridia bacterium]